MFGEIAWLDSVQHRHMTTVTSVNSTIYLEVNPSALALATDELRELFRTMLATVAVRRLGEALRELSANGEPAMAGKFTASGLDLQLVED